MTQFGEFKFMLKRIVAVLLLVLLSSQVCARETVRLTNGEWPPYLSKELEGFGVASRIVTEAFANVGIKVEYGFFPWARAYEIAKTGKWDGSVVWSYSDEREKYFYFSKPVVIRKMVFFHMKDYAFDWKTMQDLKGIPIGATLRYHYGTAFEEAEKSGLITVIRLPYDELNLRKLYHGRIKLFVGDELVTPTMIAKHFTLEQRSRFTHHPKPLDVGGYHLILSKKVPENRNLIVLFNKGLEQIRKSGMLDRYRNEFSVAKP